MPRQRDRHYLENELRELLASSDEVFDFLVDKVLDGAWFWDLEKPETEWMSAGFWRTIGHDPATREHASAEWQNLIDPEDLKIATQHAEDHFADAAKPYDMLVHYHSANGDRTAVRCKGIAIRDENGKPVRMLGAHVDVRDFVRQLRSYPEKGIKAFFGQVPPVHAFD